MYSACARLSRRRPIFAHSRWSFLKPAMPPKKEGFPMTPALRKWSKEIGRKGGKVGGIRTALNMTPAERAERARKAARARWSKKGKA